MTRLHAQRVNAFSIIWKDMPLLDSIDEYLTMAMSFVDLSQPEKQGGGLDVQHRIERCFEVWKVASSECGEKVRPFIP